MSTKKIILLLVAAAVICLAVWLAFVLFAPAGTIAVISIDGAEYKRIDLSRVKEPYELQIKTEYGRNTVLVERGAIALRCEIVGNCLTFFHVYIGDYNSRSELGQLACDSLADALT